MSCTSATPSGRYQISGVNNDASTNVKLTDLATGEDLVLKNVPDGDLAQVDLIATKPLLRLD